MKIILKNMILCVIFTCSVIIYKSINDKIHYVSVIKKT